MVQEWFPKELWEQVKDLGFRFRSGFQRNCGGLGFRV